VGSLSSLLFLLSVAFGLALTCARPFWGLICSVAYVYLAPPYKWWGVEYGSLRIALIISVVTALSFLIHRKQMIKPDKPIFLDKLFLLFLGSVIISTIFAVREVDFMNDFVIQNYFKFVVFYFLMTRIIQTKREYDWFVWANIVGCFYLARSAYLGAGHHTFGRLEGVGGIAFRYSEGLATYLCIVLPFMVDYFFVTTGRSHWRKIAITIFAPFIAWVFVETRTRAALLSLTIMALVAFMFFLRTRRGYKYILLGIVGLSGFVYLTDQAFWDRMRTMPAEADAFTSGKDAIDYPERETPISVYDYTRGDLWRAGFRMMQDHPITGVGPNNYQKLSVDYLPGLPKGRAAHNMFVLIGSENGFPGLMLIISIIVSSLALLHKIRKIPPEDSYEESIYRASVALELAFIGFLVNGLFTNTIYYEAFYWLCALIVVLYRLSWQVQMKKKYNISNQILQSSLEDTQVLIL